MEPAEGFEPPDRLRLDADVLAWLKARSEKYQSKINEVLREYMRRHP